jgi:hypothetical protein
MAERCTAVVDVGEGTANDTLQHEAWRTTSGIAAGDADSTASVMVSTIAFMVGTVGFAIVGYLAEVRRGLR